MVDPGDRLPNLDANLMDADWPKRTWDLKSLTKEDAIAFIKRHPGIAHFKTLPIYKHALANNDPPWIKEL